MRKIIILVVLVLLSGTLQADQTYSVDPDSGAGTWVTRHQGVHFSLTQILPTQARAFYVNRGLSQAQVEEYATSCVYMTVLRNDSAAGVIHFISNNWSVQVDNESHALVSVDEWVQRLSDAGVKKPGLIAFRWAQFPPEQEYQPGGDWNQGMLSFGLQPGSEFDVTARWDSDGQSYEATLEGVRCAE